LCCTIATAREYSGYCFPGVDHIVGEFNHIIASSHKIWCESARAIIQESSILAFLAATVDLQDSPLSKDIPCCLGSDKVAVKRLLSAGSKDTRLKDLVLLS